MSDSPTPAGDTACVIGDILREVLAEQLPEGGQWHFEASYEQSDPPRLLDAKDTAEYHAEQLSIVYGGQQKEAVGTKVEARDNEVYIWRTEEQRIYRALKAGDIIGPNGVPVSLKQFYGETPKYVDEHGPYKLGDMVKISGDHAAEFRDYHNQAAKIVTVYDPYHFKVRTENGALLGIRDTDIKWPLNEDDLE